MKFDGDRIHKANAPHGSHGHGFKLPRGLGPPQSDRIFHLISRLRDRTTRALQGQFDERGIGDIVPAHGGVLFALGAGPASMSELASVLERDNSTITTLVARLIERGYVARRVSDEDARSYQVTLTARGKRARRVVLVASRAVLGRFFSGMSASEQKTLTALVQRAYSNLEEG